MKPRTILLFVLVLGAIVCTALFLEWNREELMHSFTFMGFSFSVMRAFVITVLLAAVLPSIYFSLKYTRLMGRIKTLEAGETAAATAAVGQAEGEAAFRHGSYQRALELLPEQGNAPVLLPRAKSLIAQGEREQAQKILADSFSQGHDIETGYLLVQLQKELGLSPEATLKSLSANNPEHAIRAFNLLLTHYETEGNWSACLELTKQMQRHHHEIPAHRLAGYRYEWLREQSGETTKKKIEGYQQIIKQDPDFVPAHLALGDVHMETGSVEKAFRIYEQAFEKTRNPVFLDRLERYYLEQGRPEDAIQVYRQMLVRIGGPLLEFQLGKLYFKLEMLDESLATLEPLEATHAKIPGFLAYLAEIRARRLRQDEALETLKRLLANRGFSGQDFICIHCRTAYHEWQARCDHCGRWNQVTLEAALVEPERVSTSPLYY